MKSADPSQTMSLIATVDLTELDVGLLRVKREAAEDEGSAREAASAAPCG